MIDHNWTPFDVDGTLITKFTYHRVDDKQLELDYYGIKVYAKPLIGQINFMKSLKARGYGIVVWSANGAPWADEVVKKLELSKLVEAIVTKPSFCVDDKPPSEWMKQVLIDAETTE